MLNEMFFGEGSIYEKVCQEESSDTKLTGEISELSGQIRAELDTHTKQLWEVLREKEAEADRRRLFRAFCEGARMSLGMVMELTGGGEKVGAVKNSA